MECSLRSAAEAVSCSVSQSQRRSLSLRGRATLTASFCCYRWMIWKHRQAGNSARPEAASGRYHKFPLLVHTAFWRMWMYCHASDSQASRAQQSFSRRRSTIHQTSLTQTSCERALAALHSDCSSLELGKNHLLSKVCLRASPYSGDWLSWWSSHAESCWSSSTTCELSECASCSQIRSGRRGTPWTFDSRSSGDLASNSCLGLSLESELCFC